jgi:hypothetical protein
MTLSNKKKKPVVPEPPDSTASLEELSAYYEKFSPGELIDAGHVEVLSKEDARFIQHQEVATSIRSKRKRAQLNIVFNEAELSELDEYAKAIHIPVSTIAKSWILRALKTEKTRLTETRI